MAREKNFLLGSGERLTGGVDVPSGGGEKNPPYDFQTARGRIAKKLALTTRKMARHPASIQPQQHHARR